MTKPKNTNPERFQFYRLYTQQAHGSRFRKRLHLFTAVLFYLKPKTVKISTQIGFGRLRWYQSGDIYSLHNKRNIFEWIIWKNYKITHKRSHRFVDFVQLKYVHCLTKKCKAWNLQFVYKKWYGALNQWFKHKNVRLKMLYDGINMVLFLFLMISSIWCATTKESTG